MMEWLILHGPDLAQQLVGLAATLGVVRLQRGKPRRVVRRRRRPSGL